MIFLIRILLKLAENQYFETYIASQLLNLIILSTLNLKCIQGSCFNKVSDNLMTFAWENMLFWGKNSVFEILSIENHCEINISFQLMESVATIVSNPFQVLSTYLETKLAWKLSF